MGAAVGAAIGPGGREMGVDGFGEDVLGAQKKVDEVVRGRERVVVLFIEACLRGMSQSLVKSDLRLLCRSGGRERVERGDTYGWADDRLECAHG